MKIAWFFLQCIAYVLSQNELNTYTDSSSYYKCQCESQHSCYCVQDIICLANNSMNYEGADIIVFRSDTSLRETCPSGEKCCIDELNELGGEDLPVSSTTPVPSTTPSLFSCGKKGPRNRIVGDDTDTEPEEYPWMLVLLWRKDERSPWLFQCGASLVGPKYGITAAHCVEEFKDDQQRLTVTSGVWDLNDSSEVGDQDVLDIAGIHIHPQYSSKPLRNDVAIFFTKGEFQLSPRVQPVCLIRPKIFQQGVRNCVATGWGRAKHGKGEKYQSKLKQIEMPIISHKDCQNRLRKTYLGRFFRLHSSFMCAGGESNKDTCQGDGGGPLVCEYKGSYFQVGVVSWGIGCGVTSLPGVYADLTQYYVWILQTLKLVNSQQEESLK